jgi:hypothetical protein
MKEAKRLYLSRHARLRLQERTSLREEDVSELTGKFVLITQEEYENRVSYLLFSKHDENFIIFVIDVKEGEIVTVIPIEYWNNMRSRELGRFVNKKGVALSHLLEAVKAVDPDHEILQHTPLFDKEGFYLFVSCYMEDKVKKLRGELLETATLIDCKGKAIAYINELILDFHRSFGVIPKLVLWSKYRNPDKKNDKVHMLEMEEGTNTSEIYDAILFDLYERRRLEAKYPKLQSYIE